MYESCFLRGGIHEQAVQWTGDDKLLPVRINFNYFSVRKNNPLGRSTKKWATMAAQGYKWSNRLLTCLGRHLVALILTSLNGKIIEIRHKSNRVTS